MSIYQNSFVDALLMPLTRRRATKVGLTVGTILVVLNHGDAIVAGNWPVWWKIAFTYLVPYSVSSYSTAAFIREMGNSRLPEPVGEAQ